MRSLITGGGGFIGSHLAEKLVKMNHKVIVIDNFSVGRKSNLHKIICSKNKLTEQHYKYFIYQILKGLKYEKIKIKIKIKK